MSFPVPIEYGLNDTKDNTIVKYNNGTEWEGLPGPDGGGDVAEEVENIRIGADDTVYPTAGDAVRGQVTDLKKDLSEIVNEAVVDKTANRKSDIFTLYQTNGYLSYADGHFVADNSWHCFLYTFEHDTDITIARENGSGTGMVGAVLFSEELDTIPTLSSGAKTYYLKGGRSDKTGTESLPSESNIWNCKTGQMICIFTQDNANNPNTNFTMEYEGVKHLLNNDIYLNSFQEEQIQTIAGNKKPCLQYVPVNSTELPFSYFKEQINLYIPTTVGYLKYLFVRNELDSKNANNWRLDKAFACDENKDNRFLVVNSGEYEMALKIDGRDDFIGGIAHGDEVLGSITFLVNGNEIADITALTALTQFDELKIVETTDLYDPADGATLSTRGQFSPVAQHGKEYTFTKDGLRLRQFVSWNVVETLNASYMTMLPMVRGNDSVSQLQITDTFYADDDYLKYYVGSLGDISGKAWAWRKNIDHAVIWSDISGVSAEVIMVKQPQIVNNGARQFKVQSAEAYNKLYWSVCGVGDDLYNVSVGERFGTESIYKLNICK